MCAAPVCTFDSHFENHSFNIFVYYNNPSMYYAKPSFPVDDHKLSVPSVLNRREELDKRIYVEQCDIKLYHTLSYPKFFSSPANFFISI